MKAVNKYVLIANFAYYIAQQLNCLDEDLKTNIWSPSRQKIGIFTPPNGYPLDCYDY